MANPRFKDKMMQSAYEGARKAAADNWSEFYLAKTTAGLNPFGPNMPHRGAGHRCAYWDGRKGLKSMYVRAKNTLGYAFYAAGDEDRKQSLKKKSS